MGKLGRKSAKQPPCAPRQTSSGAIQAPAGKAGDDPERRRDRKAIEYPVSGGQNRAAGGCHGLKSNLRDRFSRLLVWVQTGQRAARCSGRAECGRYGEESQLGAGSGHQSVLRYRGT